MYGHSKLIIKPHAQIPHYRHFAYTAISDPDIVLTAVFFSKCRDAITINSVLSSLSINLSAVIHCLTSEIQVSIDLITSS